MKNLLTLFLVLLTLLLAHAQEIKWKTAPQTGLVFEISNKEAKKLLRVGTTDSIYKKLLHTQIDTFDVTQGWLERPSKGHFILAQVKQNKLHCDYTAVFPYQVFLFSEYNALALQVLDLQGNVREDAKVKLGFTKIAFDKESKTYRIENEWVHRTYSTVTVELEGFLSIYNIEKHAVPTWYDYNNYAESGPDFYSYMITDKNKYKPHDSVRFKSYALSQYQSPIRNSLDIYLQTFQKSVKLGVVEPHRPGSFAHEFQLHDSLGLQLDRNYRLELREKNGRVVASCNFYYEDYELFGNKLDISLATESHFYPANNTLTITATDVNGLILKDAKADILIKTGNILQTFQPLAILHDTLLFEKINLDPAAPTIFVIPSEIFQKTNTNYEVLVTVLNSQNERLELVERATFYYSQYDLVTRFSNDSICFDILKNNTPMQNEAVELSFDDDIHSQQVYFPLKLKLNPAIKSYNFKNENISKQILLSSLNPAIYAEGVIKQDSFYVQITNSQRLDVSWYVYQGSDLLFKGFGQELDTALLIENRSQTFYIELLYSFGAREHSKRSQIEFKEEFLDVSLDIPDKIFPGQQVDATITVKNQMGYPVRNVDLTALAVTGKLNYRLPNLPYYGSSSIPRPKMAHYTKTDVSKYSVVFDLDYKKWVKKLDLDTMRYYQFIYPWNNYFKFLIEIGEGSQFAPYVMKGGQAMQIYVIEVDRKPVYYSWTDQPDKYSFAVTPDIKHEITLRMHDRVIILDSMTFEKGKKTIISIDIEHYPEKIKEQKLKDEFTSVELNRHRPLIAAFHRVPYNYAYLQSEGEFITLHNRANIGFYNSKVLAGPIYQSYQTYTREGDLRTRYRHEGGYIYSFEDNIVYKQDDKDQIPKKLYTSYYDPMININDLVLTKRQFLDLQNQKPPVREWFAGILDYSTDNSRLKLFLPRARSKQNIALVLFEDCKNKKTHIACYSRYSTNNLKFLGLPNGLHNAVVVYSDGSYLKMDSVHMRSNSNYALDMSCAGEYPADSVSRRWLIENNWQLEECFIPKTEYKYEKSHRTSSYIIPNKTGNVTGVVYDNNNEPLPGVSIVVKGTMNGCITDLDGNFAIYIDDYISTLVFSYLGYVSEELEVERGSHVVLNMEEEIMNLDEVIVVGYGVTRKSDLTGAVASIEGRMAGVSVEENEEPEGQVEEEKIIKEAEQRLYQELLTLNTIRSNFADVGFWEPRLYTDKKGQSKFTVKFPDDITRWDATVYAMNRRLQTGTARKSIKSYKPLMAELHVPPFLTKGDSADFLGKVLNYTEDKNIVGEISWQYELLNSRDSISFGEYYINKLPVYVSTTDSLTTSFSFIRDDGYTDGEERTISVVEQGVVRADGKLSFINNGQIQTIKASNNETINIEIIDNQTDIYTQQINQLLNYRYDCNEQLASKLIGFISYKYYMQYKGKKFSYDQDVNRIIRRLIKNQNQDFLWSWWEISPNTSYWMSAHILNALKYAQDAGYTVDLNVDNLARKASYKYELLSQYSIYDVELLNCLSSWKANLNYPKYIKIIDSLLVKEEYKVLEEGFGYNSGTSYLIDKLLMQELRQKTGIDYQRDTLLKYQKEGILGDIYFSDGRPFSYWYSDNMSANVIAYRLIKNDSSLQYLKTPMQMHFIGLRRNSDWNTFQSSNIIMNVFPDLLSAGMNEKIKASLTLIGKENKVINEFPYKISLQPEEELTIKKESGMPLYFMQYKNERITKAKTGVEGFSIRSYFEGDIKILEEGKPVILNVEVTVSKQAKTEYVMIEIPIPGSCSYGDKHLSNYVETHREYFKEKTVIFCQNLTTGTYTFKVNLLPRFTGSYILNPAQVSLMYFPVVNANTDMKRVRVKSR